MSPDSSDNGTSFLSRLGEFWVKRMTPKSPVKLDEELVTVSHEHWIKYVFPTFLYIILMGGGLILFYFAALSIETAAGFSSFLFIAAIILLFVIHHWFFWFILAESQAHIIVTNKRVIYIHENLLWREKMLEVAFGKVKTVEVSKTNLLQSVLNYGTLEFEGKGKMTRVPHPGTLARTIEQTMGMI